MQSYIDFSSCESSGIQYAGSEQKTGIIFNGQCYMLKFQKILNGRKMYNHVSEYIASHLMEMAGLEVHDTLLGMYQGMEVVAVKDFIAGTEYSLVEFASGGDSSYDTEREEHTAYTYEEILYLVQKHTKIQNPKEILTRFWDMFVMDALLANFDRHGYNWGFVKNGIYQLAPIYDNGSSLFPRLQDEELTGIMNSVKEMDKRTYTFPTSQIKLGNQKSSYYQVISSHQFPGCDEAIQHIIKNINLEDMYEFIDGAAGISDIRKRFYKTIIQYRYSHIFGL